MCVCMSCVCVWEGVSVCMYADTHVCGKVYSVSSSTTSGGQCVATSTNKQRLTHLVVQLGYTGASNFSDHA